MIGAEGWVIAYKLEVCAAAYLPPNVQKASRQVAAWIGTQIGTLDAEF